jgi:hypothetical protein
MHRRGTQRAGLEGRPARDQAGQAELNDLCIYLDTVASNKIGWIFEAQMIGSTMLPTTGVPSIHSAADPILVDI